MNKEQVIEFSTIEEIINTIHIGNKDAFLTDFKAWLDIVVNTTQTVRMTIELGGTDEQKDQYKDIANSELIGCKTMKWIDDGKHNISITVTMQDEQSK